MKQEIKNFLEFNEIESTIYQNLWDMEKVVLKGNIIAMNAYNKNKEKSQINDLMLHLKLLEKQKQAKPKTSKREIIKIKEKLNEIKTKESIKQKSFSLER
jgi:uncharacterized protein YlxW (UPF0749 family)